MVVSTDRRAELIDEEWLSLILEAKELGLSIQSVRDFFNQNHVRELVTKNK